MDKKRKKSAKKGTNYDKYKNKSWFKAMRVTQRLMATKRMLEKYRKLEKKLTAELKKYK